MPGVKELSNGFYTSMSLIQKGISWRPVGNTVNFFSTILSLLSLRLYEIKVQLLFFSQRRCDRRCRSSTSSK